MKNKIIFLDIDGVLNSGDYLEQIKYKKRLVNSIYNYSEESETTKIVINIDANRLCILRDIIRKTNAKVVIISSYRLFNVYPKIKQRFINFGIPVVGETTFENGDRYKEIKKYLDNNIVDNFIIIDDIYFQGFEDNFIITLLYNNNGMDNDVKKECIKKLKKV